MTGGVHLIDQILFMMPDAKIKSVYADIKNVLHEEVDDYFKIILKMDNGVTAHIELSTYILKYQPRWIAAGDKGTMVVNTFGCDGAIYRTGKMLEKLPPQITETEAGPTRQFAPVPPGGIVEEKLPEIETDWVDFYRNVDDVLNKKAESKIKIQKSAESCLSWRLHGSLLIQEKQYYLNRRSKIRWDYDDISS